MRRGVRVSGFGEQETLRLQGCMYGEFGEGRGHGGPGRNNKVSGGG